MDEMTADEAILNALISCCVKCGTAPAFGAETVNGVPYGRLSPRCSCHTDFHIWVRTTRQARANDQPINQQAQQSR